MPVPASERRRLAIVGMLFGFAYGVIFRLAFSVPRLHLSGLLAIMSLAFVVGVPFAIGFTAVYWAERRENQPPGAWIGLVVLPLFAAMVAACLLMLEGWICIVFMLPIGLLAALLGGVIGGMTGRWTRNRRWGLPIFASVLVLPFVIGPVEQRSPPPRQMRTVENTIEIHAPARLVWRNVERVPAISPAELPVTWTQRVGFPRPVEATLSHEGVGGVRHASFERGVLFAETVDRWEPERVLAFSIRADRVPESALDEHVTIGGAYFDVLRGEYRLEPLPNGSVRLHLRSEHRLSTDFNWYAHLWTDAVMADVQRNILAVLKARCERSAGPVPDAVKESGPPRRGELLPAASGTRQ